MSIKIPVSADFDPGQIEQQIQQINQRIASMGAAVAKASGQKFEPITLKGRQDLEYFLKQSQQLLKIQGELNKRMTATGQGGKTPFEANWSKMYLDEKVRTRRMREALVFMGASFESVEPPPPRPPQPRPSQPQQRNPWVSAGIGAVQSGLRGLNGPTGGAGGVAANALGAGMSSGFGAGLMGLMGGMLALGVGKIVSAATEKIDQAERNAIAYDTLKRTLGDVNVSFRGLKTVVEGAAGNVKLTFEEATRLGSQFAKLGNLTADQYKTLGAEIETGTGLSRAYGLDPSRGVGTLGTLRGMRLTENEQDSRKMALLIGETIARSNAFAKADEVMDAIANYATMQARYGMGANVGGYAGALAALTSSGIKGLDVTGSANILGAVNAALTNGGAKGEASQFFTGSIGASLGLNPFQTRVLREGGAFGTLNDAFGEDSAAAAFGLSGPGGSDTLLELTLSRLKRQYGGNKGMLADATANHLGIGMRQAMALISSTEKFGVGGMGQMAKTLEGYGVDLKDLNAGGIASLSKVLLGSDADRRGVAEGLRGRTGKDALSASEQLRLDQVMTSGTVDQQKELLAQLVASRDQEASQGKDIRDSKNAVENIKTLMAEQLLPVTQAMRDGIMYMAGGKDGKSSQTIREELAGIEVKDRYGRRIREQEQRRREAIGPQFAAGLTGSAYAERMAESRRIQVEATQEIARLKKEEAEVIRAEVGKLRENARRAEEEQRRLREIQNSAPPAGPIPGIHPMSALKGAGSAAGEPAPPRVPGIHPISVGSAVTPTGSADTSTNAGLAGVRGFRNNNPGNLVDTIQWKGMVGSDGRFAKFATPEMGYRAMGKNLLAYQSKHGLNTVRGIISRWAPPGENNTAAYIAKISKELGVGPDDQLNLRDQQTLTKLMTGITRHENGGLLHDQAVIGAGAEAALGGQGTPLPENPQASRGDQRFKFDAVPIEIIHKNERGEQVRAPQMLATTVRPASPFGTERIG